LRPPVYPDAASIIRVELTTVVVRQGWVGSLAVDAAIAMHATGVASAGGLAFWIA
jgi:hypothetical protein